MKRNIRSRADRDTEIVCNCGAVLGVLPAGQRVARTGEETLYECPDCGKVTRVRVQGGSQ